MSGGKVVAWADAGEPAEVMNVALTEGGFGCTVPLVLQSDLAAAIARAERYKVAWEEYSERTEWVQASATSKELGMHRADVLRLRIEQAIARAEAAEAYRDLVFDGVAVYDALPEALQNREWAVNVGLVLDALASAARAAIAAQQAEGE